MLEDKHITVNSEEQLFDAISRLIDESRKQVAKAVNTAMVYTYYGVGQYIVEFEQGGKARAAQGKGVLIRLSARLKEKYGKGWSVETLTKCRKFYMVFSISSPLETKSKKIVPTGDQIHKFILPWSHYQIIMREENPQARSFYEIEAQYVNYFDRYKRLEFEKPTIGILLCKDKNDALVELTLPKDANIYAQQYALCLPKKEELQQKLKEWISEYEESHDTSDSNE